MAKKSPPPQNSLDVELVREALEDDYDVLEELGRGGMAVVYRAKEKALDREVAIKVLPSFMSMDADFVERFQHEARTAGNLEHPNIVPIYRVGKEGRVIYFVMKLLRGKSLAAVLRERTKLTVAEVRRILIETSSALGYAARRGIVHRDIKPDNILLDDEGRCVLTDFGIAKSAGGPLTAAGTSMGTPRYMSPEHARGITLDGRSDMYSLGVVAYQCLTGVTPFDADDPFAILYKHINEPLPRPALTTEEAELYSVIEKMLAKLPEDRYQNAEELITALGGGSHSSAPTMIAGVQHTTPIAFTTGTAHRPSGLSATEIIVTPTFGTRVLMLSKDKRAWATAAGLAVLAFGTYSLKPNITLSSGAVPPPVVGGTTTALVGATTRVVATPGSPAGGTTAAGVPIVVDTTTGTKAAIPAGATTGARVAATSDSAGTKTAAPAPPAGLSRIGGAPVASRSPVRTVASKCPASARPDTVFAVLVDSVRDQKPGSRFTVNYDVCRLTPGAPFETTFRLRKLDQGRIRGRMADRVSTSLESAAGARSRHRYEFDLNGIGRGRYAIDVLVRNAKGREIGTTQEFQIPE
jgi:hypothetical protein